MTALSVVLTALASLAVVSTYTGTCVKAPGSGSDPTIDSQQGLMLTAGFQ